MGAGEELAVWLAANGAVWAALMAALGIARRWSERRHGPPWDPLARVLAGLVVTACYWGAAAWLLVARLSGR